MIYSFLHLFQVDGKAADFTVTVEQRLQQLSASTPEFLSLLDGEVQRLNVFFMEQTKILLDKYNSVMTEESRDIQAAECRSLLQSVVRLEKFIFLNFTGPS
jgi:hypothetical protein